MATLELVRFLSRSAEDLLTQAETAQPENAVAMVDEAEEMLALGASILTRRAKGEVQLKEAA